MDGQATTWRRNIAENFNRLSRAHQRYRQTDGQPMTYSEHELDFTFAKKGVLADSDVLNVPVMRTRTRYTVTWLTKLPPVSAVLCCTPNRCKWSTVQTYSYRLIPCLSATAVTHVISISCSADWGVPVWYFSGRKCRYDLYPSREVPVLYTVPLRALVTWYFRT